MLINSSQEEGGEGGVWLRVIMWNSLVLNLRTTVRAKRDFVREVDHTLCARRRITGSVCDNGMSCSKVSSADTDFVGLCETTLLSSTPRASSYRRSPYRPNRFSSVVISIFCNSPTVLIPSRRSFSSVTLP